MSGRDKIFSFFLHM